MALSKTTQDHDEIKAWAEERGGKPAEVASTETKDGPGILRLEFPGAVHANDSNLKEISWDDFFAKFDESGLALVYQDVTADGEKSNFNRLIHPENASGGSASTPAARPVKAKGKASSGGKTPTKTAAKKAPTKSASKPPAPAKKAAAAKKTAPAKAAAKSKPVATKTPAKATNKATAAPAKKSPMKAVAGKKAAGKNAPAKKASATKAAAKKSPAKKVTAKKTARR